MKHLIIIGARGWGREVYDLAAAYIAAGADMDIKGFLDDKADALDGKTGYPHILGPVETYEIQKDDVFICALGDVHYKKHYSDIIQGKGGEFVTLIHPTAMIGNNVIIGKGCIIGAYANLSSDTKLGDFVTFSIKAGIGHDSTIDNFSHIGAMTNISGYVTIGKSVTIHPCCNIIPHRKIGDKAIVGASSVVLLNVAADTTVFGNPAKRVDY